jgi:hypothetical protein
MPKSTRRMEITDARTGLLMLTELMFMPGAAGIG